MSVEERVLFDSWLRSAANAAAMKEMEGAWAALGSAPASTRGAVVQERRQPARAALMAAACVASLGIGVLSYGGEDHPFWAKLDWEAR